MKLGGRGFREHLRLLAPLFGLIAAVWVLRLILGETDVPRKFTAVFSVTAAAAVSVLLAVFLLHFRQFGGYPSVVLASFLLIFWGQFLVVAAIVFSVLTGTENIFTQPEFSIPQDDPHHVHHILGHLTFGLGGGTLIGAAMGCLLLALLRVLMPNRLK